MANFLDEIIEQFGGYDKLSEAEKLTYADHLKIVEGNTITIEDTKNFVRMMINNLERALCDTKENTNESRGMKCRLKNFLMLEQFLFAPDKAREALKKFYKK